MYGVRGTNMGPIFLTAWVLTIIGPQIVQLIVNFMLYIAI